MERADPERSARPAPAHAGTLGLQPRGTSQAGTEAEQPADSGPASRPPRRDRWLPRVPWRTWLRRAAGNPLVRQIAVLVVYIAAGIAVTWPRASYLTSQLLPESRDSASYTWGFWWVAQQVIHL